MDAGSITATVRATADAFKSVINGVKKDIQDIAKQTQEQAKKASDAANEIAKGSKNIADGAKEAQAQISTIAVTSTAALYGMVRGIGDITTVTNKFNNSLIGLKSTSVNMNIDLQKTTEAAQKLTSDGLMTIGQAATGLKNLLIAGFGLNEAVDIMNGFKDSAAFGRQASLEFGEAIASATEGIKNGNSILVDNAGVTKNLSLMLREAGYAEQDLMKASTDAGVRMAIYNGILKETAHQSGDAAKLAGTLSGQMSQFSVQSNMTRVAVGNALTPTLQDFYSVLGYLNKGMTDLTNAHPGLVAGIIKITVSVTGLIALFTTLAILIPKVRAGIELLNTTLLKSPWGWAAIAIGVVIGVIYELIAANEKAKKVQEEYSAALEKHNKLVKEGIDKSEISSVQEDIDKMKELAKQYDEINEKIEAMGTYRYGGGKDHAVQLFNYNNQLKNLRDQMAQYGADEKNIIRLIKEKEEAIKSANRATVEDFNTQAVSIAQKYATIQATKELIKTYETAEKGSASFKDAQQKLAEIFPQYSTASGIAIKAIKSVTEAQELAAKTEFILLQQKARLQRIDIENTIATEELKVTAMKSTIQAMAGEEGLVNALIVQKVAQYNEAEKKLKTLKDNVKVLKDLENIDITKVSGVAPVSTNSNTKTSSSSGTKQNKELDAALEIYEYRKHLNQLTLEDEVKTLEQIEAKHAKTAEEKRRLELMIYDVKQEIAAKTKELEEKQYQETIDGVNKVNEFIIKGLQERYEKERDEREKSLENELDSLDNWKDESLKGINTVYTAKKKAIEESTDAQVKALQAEIDALDQAEKLKERSEQDVEELKKINGLQALIEYEHNEFNKVELQKELDKLIKERENRLHKEQVADKKDALKSQIDAIKENAQIQKELLEEQKQYEIENINNLYNAQKLSLETQLNDVKLFYAEKLNQASLEAESEKLIMQNNQVEIVELLKGFAQEYENAGKTLGERLMAGIKPNIDEIRNMISSITAQVSAAKQSAVDAMSSISSQSTSQKESVGTNKTTIISPSLTIVKPMDTPSEERRTYENTLVKLGYEWGLGS